jgi:RimJ/RimL family protein N-acetyltransferase
LDRVTLPEVIETPRLLLRSWKFGDVDDVFAYAQDPEWSRYLRLLPVDFDHAMGELGYSI